MLIVVEGSNGAGKTVLVERLEEELKRRDPEGEVVRYHRGPPELHPLDEYARPLWDYRPNDGTNVICERWHLGEVVYPEVLGRPTAQTPGVLLWIEMFLRSRGAVLVHVTGEEDDIVERFATRDREHWHVSASQVPGIVGAFRQAFARSLVRKIEVTNVLDEDAAAFIVDEALEADLDVASAALFETYIGSSTPGVVLLGDRRGTGGEPPDGPAFGPYPGTSGLFLMDALAAQPDARFGGIGVANACDVDDPRALWHDLGWPILVPLGRLARDRLRRLPLPYRGSLPHPQYVRRFQHGLQEEYGAAVVATCRQRQLFEWSITRGWPLESIEKQPAAARVRSNVRPTRRNPRKITCRNCELRAVPALMLRHLRAAGNPGCAEKMKDVLEELESRKKETHGDPT